MLRLTSFIAVAAFFPIAAAPGAPKPPGGLRQDTFESASVGPATKPVDLAEYQTVLYVAPDGTGRGSRDAPLPSPAAALEWIHAARAAGRCAIIVGAGTYATVDLPMRSNVDLFGGFAAGEWSRDIFKHRTVLDAQKKGRVLIGADRARLDGFTITGGSVRAHGGAIDCRDASPLLTNNVFFANETLAPHGYDFSKKHQLGNCGGAINIAFNGIPVVANNLFAENTTEVGDGGAIYCYEMARPMKGPQPIVRNNVFLSNRAGRLDPPSKPKASPGGAIAIVYNAFPTIAGNVFVGNTTGGGSDAGAIYCAYGVKPIIRGNWFVGNGAGDDGGAMAVKLLSEPIIEGNVFAGNWCIDGNNTGIRLNREGRAILTHNLFTHNLGTGSVGCTHSWMTFTHNTVVDNDGHGIYYANWYSYFMPTIIKHNIIHGNAAGDINLTNGSKGPPPEIALNGLQAILDGTDNVSTAPRFVDDGFRGQIANAKQINFTSVFEVTGVPLPANLAGRVIRVGDRWGVVKDSTTSSLTVWGDMRVEAEDKRNSPDREFEIIPTYTQTSDSAVADFGWKPGARTRAAD